MVRRTEQICMFSCVVLLATSTWTHASPLPTSEPESVTLSTTEVVTLTTLSTIAPQGSTNFSFVSTLPPAEMTTFPETDLYATTEFTLGGGDVATDPIITARPSLPSEGSQVIFFEQEALTKDNTTQLVNVSSYLMTRDGSESVSEPGDQSTTISWISSTLAEMDILSQDSYTGTDLYTNVTESKITVQAEVSPNVTNVTSAHKSTSGESLKSIGASKENTESKLTNTSILTPTREYSTTERISTSVLPTEMTPYLETVDSEVPEPATVHKQHFTEEIAKLIEESSKTFEKAPNITKNLHTSTEEAAKHTEKPALLKPTGEAAKRTGEDASPKPPGEKAKRTEEAGLPEQRKQEPGRFEEFASVTEKDAETTEEKNLTIGATKPHEEFQMQTGEKSKPTTEVVTDVSVSSGNKSIKAEIFISSGYTPKTYVSLSSDNIRESRDYTEEASKAKSANGTQSQPEIISPKRILTGLETNTSVTQSSVTTSISEQTKPPTSIHLQNNSASGDINSDEPSFTSQATLDTISTKVNVSNAFSPNTTEEPTTIFSQLHSNTPQPITPRELSVNTDVETKNVFEPSLTHSVEAKNKSGQRTTQEFPSKSDMEVTVTIIGSATDPPLNSKSSNVETSQSMVEDTGSSLFIDTTRASSPSSVSLENGVNTMEKAGANKTIECSPEPVVSVFQGDVRFVIVLGLTGCSVAATLLLVTLVLIRLRESKQRDTSPSFQICGCLGRTQRAEITPRRAEVSEVKLRPGCNLATDADCRAGEGEDVALALSAGTLKVSAPPAPASMTVKPNGAPPLPPKPGDSPV